MDEKSNESGYSVTKTDDLRDEAFVLMGAASETTGNVMTVATYYTLSNPDIYQRIHEELKQAFPDSDSNLPFLALEKLPYLV